MPLDPGKWIRDCSLMSRFFSAGEISLIADRLMGIKARSLVYCSF